MRAARLPLVALLAAGCAAAGPPPTASPTPTRPPTPTPIVIYVTQSPAAATPTPAATPSPASPSNLAITVFFHLTDPYGIATDGDSCWGKSGYAAIHAGMQVTVDDGDGHLLGFSTFMNDGTVMARNNSGQATDCLFMTNIFDLPDEQFYSIDVADHGAVLFSRSYLLDNYGFAVISLGPVSHQSNAPYSPSPSTTLDPARPTIDLESPPAQTSASTPVSVGGQWCGDIQSYAGTKDPTTTFDLAVDGLQVPIDVLELDNYNAFGGKPCLADKWFVYEIQSGLPAGLHRFRANWYYLGTRTPDSPLTVSIQFH